MANEPTPRALEIAKRIRECADSEGGRLRLIWHAPADLSYLMTKLGWGHLVDVPMPTGGGNG